MYQNNEEISMSIETHIKSLNSKHNQIEEKLHEAYIHRLPTAELKKAKLGIKDQIQKLAQKHAA
jgi:hypothetical protein